MWIGSGTTAADYQWYHGLERSALTPPDWVFAPVWTILYALLGWVLLFLWRRRETYRLELVLFCLQLCANYLWSVLFFRMHSPLLALLDIICMDVVTFFIWIRLWHRGELKAALILLPYLLWIFFATYLAFFLLTSTPIS